MMPLLHRVPLVAASRLVCLSRAGTASFGAPAATAAAALAQQQRQQQQQQRRALHGAFALCARRASDVEREPLAPTLTQPASSASYVLPHPLWNGKYVNDVQLLHRPPRDRLERLAYLTIKAMRFNFDWMSGYSWRRLTEKIWLNRVCFLETVAGIPGSVAYIIRHTRSLRRLKRDHGWIHTLLEEAENERMHLLVAMQLKQPSISFRVAVFLTQGVFFNFFFLAYLITPRFCHALVHYLEEEAVKTYTHCLSEIDKGHLNWAKVPAPKIAIDYWKLPADATMRDVVQVLRADEAHHRDTNFMFSSLKPDDPNPIPPGWVTHHEESTRTPAQTSSESRSANAAH